MEDCFNRIFNEGLEIYAKERDFTYEIFRVDVPKNISAFDKLCYKKDITDFRVKYYQSLRDQLISKIKNYDKIVFVNLFFDKIPFIDENLAKVLSEHNCILYWVDSIRTLEFRGIEFKYWSIFKRIASFEFSDCEYAKTKYNIDVDYIHSGTNYITYSLNKNAEKEFDLCFVGAHNPKRLEYLDLVAQYCDKNNIKFFVAGHFWHNSNVWSSFIGKLKFKKRHPILYKFVKNNFIQPDRLAELYTKSKIVLNINIGYHKSLNQRHCDVIYSGSILISDEVDVRGLDEELCKYFISCKSKKEMVEQIDKVLNNYASFKEKFKNGAEFANKNYTILNVYDELLR